jgi:dolichol kinase
VTGFSEDRRQILHIAVGFLALLLRWLSWGQALAMAALAVVFNLTLLPRLAGPSIYRSSDRHRGAMTGIVLYPVAVLVLLAVFPGRPDLVAAAWGILAFGDGFATLIGRRGATRLPWNREKSVEGTMPLGCDPWSRLLPPGCSSCSRRSLQPSSRRSSRRFR